MKKEQLVEYDILRIIVTLLVIFGHTTYYQIITPYGGCDYGTFVPHSGPNRVYCLLDQLVGYVYSFHMPLYMMLSGALYRYSKSTGGYRTFRNLVSIKAKKLLLPFMIVTAVYAVPLKYISGYYTLSEQPLKDILIGQFLIQGNTHLWFLPTLFLIFLFVHALEKWIPWPQVNLLIFFITHFLCRGMPIVIFYNVGIYCFWFYLGNCFESIRPILNAKLRWLPVVVGGGSFILLMAVTVVTMSIPDTANYEALKKMGVFLRTVSICFVIYNISFLLGRTKIMELKILQNIRSNSFGLYLYSEPLNYIVLLTVVQRSGNLIFGTDLGSILFVLLRFVVTFLGAFLVCYVMRKLKWKYLI